MEAHALARTHTADERIDGRRWSCGQTERVTLRYTTMSRTKFRKKKKNQLSDVDAVDFYEDGHLDKGQLEYLVIF